MTGQERPRLDRREVLTAAGALGAVAGLGACAQLGRALGVEGGPLYDISLAQWSLHRALWGGELDNLGFAAKARDDFDIGAVEYVNSFFKDKARDDAYLAEMVQRADDAGVKSLLIMVDGEGSLGHHDEDRRAEAIANHHRWVDAAAKLGCHAIRVNAAGDASRGREEIARLAADSLHQLAEYGADQDISVIVENHGGFSSDGSWLAGVMELADHPGVGTLPDFGNFRISGDEEYDRYLGVEELMPYAKAVSAKSHQFDADGFEVHTDYRRMMRLVVDAGYRGFVGVEYEGSQHTEDEGIALTKALLERVRDELAGEPTSDAR